jgi:hypothetical protein
MLLSSTVSKLLAARGSVEIVLSTTISAETVARNLNLEASLIEVQGNKLHIKESMQQSVVGEGENALLPLYLWFSLHQGIDQIMTEIWAYPMWIHEVVSPVPLLRRFGVWPTDADPPPTERGHQCSNFAVAGISS